MGRIKALLKNLKLIIIAEGLVNCFIYYFFYSFAADFVFILISKVIYIDKISFGFAAIHIFFFVVWGIIFAIKLPSIEELVKTADSLGFKERFATACELLKKEGLTVTEELAVEDCVKNAEEADFKELYKISVKKKTAAFALALLFFCVLFFFIPSPFSNSLINQKNSAEKISRVRQIIKEEEEHISSAEKKKILKELEKNIRFKNNENDISQEIKNSEIKLNQADGNEAEELSRLGEELKKNDIFLQAADGIEKTDSDKIKAAFNELESSIENISYEDINSAADILKNADIDIASLDTALKEAGEALTQYADGESGKDELKRKTDKLMQELINSADRAAENNDENREISMALSQAKELLGEKNGLNIISGGGSGHIEDSEENYNETEKEEEDFVILSQNYGSDSQKNSYAQEAEEDKISKKGEILQYSESALKNAESGNLSEEEKDAVLKYFSELE